MPLSLSVANAVRRPVGWVWRWAWRILWGGVAVLLAGGLAAWLALHWLILPRLDAWRPQIEAQAGRALGHPVQIGGITVRSGGWMPAFALTEVVLRDAQGREALRLPQVSAALSARSLLGLRLRFDQLLIEDARLEVRRDAQGRWHVAGLGVEAAGAAMDGSAAADWFFEQGEFIIRGGVLRWVDEQRAAPPLQLSDVLLVVRNPGHRHELRLDATPPPDWGQRFSLRALARRPLLARPGDWQRWNGSLFADLPQVDVNGLRRHVDLPVDLRQGQAALRAWVDFDQGLPNAVTLDAALRAVSVRLAVGLEPMTFASLGGHFSAERSATDVKLDITRLSFTTGEGQSWAASQLSAQWQQAQARSLAQAGTSHPVTAGRFSADRLDLAMLAELGERLPIGASLRRLLMQLNPEGTVQALQAEWDGALDAPSHYRVRAKVQGLAIAAAPSPEPGGIGRPGWRGADLDINASEAGGQAGLSLADGAIELPGVFEAASVPLAHFNAQLKWRIEPMRAGAGVTPSVTSASGSQAPQELLPRIELTVQNARFDNADARGMLNASWHSGAGAGFGKGGRLPGVLALSGTLSEGRAQQVARYLPLGIGATTRDWVRRAVQGGELREVAYQVQGDLWDFPFVNRRDGEFRLTGQVVDATLAPIPSAPAGGDAPAWPSPWPAFSAVNGRLVFERNAMRFEQASGKLWGLTLSDVTGRIPELSAQAQLALQGQIRGPASDLLRYVRGTPLADWTGQALAQASATGASELSLALTIPLAHADQTQVKAALTLPGNDLHLRADLPLLTGAKGRVDISHKGVQLVGLRSQLAGGELQIDGGTQADGGLRFSLAGTASADGLRHTPELGAPLLRLAQHLQGQASYKALLGLQGGHAEWQLASSLQGMAITLPAPLGKTAEASTALRVGFIAATDLAVAGPGPPAVPAGDARRSMQQDWLRLELGALQASLVIDPGGGVSTPTVTTASSPEAGPRLARAALAYGRRLPEPVAGGVAVLTLPQLDLDAWQALLDPPASGPPGATGGGADLAAWLPHSVQLKTPELLVGGRRLTGVSVDVQRLTTAGDEGWRVQGEADQAAGGVDYREPRSRLGAGRIQARLSRLSLPPSDAETVADSVAGLLDRSPTSVPALDIEIEDFELRGHRLGRLSVQAANHAPNPAEAASGARSEWRLSRLTLTNPDATLNATGRWQAQGGRARRRMALAFDLDISNGGALLQRLGKGKLVLGAAGQIRGNLGWDGSPLDFDIPSLEGQLALAISKGRFLKADAGAARLLGVLSLQALPRRLLLDFRDVFDEGFSFDTLAGDVQIRRGVASTDNLRARGLQAVVLMAGSADIGRETQDLTVLAVPELNTASAALAYAAINPAVALGAFVGQWLFREPLRQASTREFRVTGRWDDPQVERVERKLLAPLPAVDAAASAPAASSASSTVPPATLPVTPLITPPFTAPVTPPFTPS